MPGLLIFTEGFQYIADVIWVHPCSHTHLNTGLGIHLTERMYREDVQRGWIIHP